MPLPDATTDVTVGAVVSICGPPGTGQQRRQVGGVAGSVRDVAAVEIDRRSPPGRRYSVRPPPCS